MLNDVIDARVPIQHEKTSENIPIGTIGEAHTALRPMGRVSINGTTFEAKTLGEMINQGDDVKVIGIENQYVVVSKV